MTKLSPMRMIPAFRYGEMTPWGGLGLQRLGKKIPDARTGESLEVSVLPGLESRSEDGRTLPELLECYGPALRGTAVGTQFPLLLKLISADDWLSVQVHPDNAYASLHEGGKLGKTEAWLILEAKPDAEIIFGMMPFVTPEHLREACGRGGEALRACLRRIPVKAGEVYYIPAGTVHALGSGVTLLEIQQSSDVTYRFYDWDRVGANGQSRPLHIEQGLDVIKTGVLPEVKEGIAIGKGTVRYIGCPAFVLEKWMIRGERLLGATPTHMRLLCALGSLELTWEDGRLRLEKGDTVLLPAQMKDCLLRGDADAVMCCP